MFGKGLNSFRVRFAIVTAVLLGGLLGAEIVVTHVFGKNEVIHEWLHAGLFAFSLLGVMAMYLMTGKLTRPIEALKASTEAIARGDFETTVQVDCNCEIGGLADSFRVMVNRLNSNVSKINTLAFQDGITGLPNRSALNRLLPELKGTSGALLFIDLDKFKQVNDTLGHDLGDRLLLMVAQRIALCLGSAGSELACGIDIAPEAARSRLLFRFAGDEFIALLAGQTDRDELARTARSIVEALARPFPLDDNNVQIGASIGIALYPADSADISDVLTFADLAMYHAKRNGRGCSAFFDNRMRDEALERARLEAELRLALERDELRVHFQPKVETATGRLAGVEALVRWQHPDKGLLHPAAFLDIAESAGLIAQISRQVAMKSAAQSLEWRKAGLHVPVAINICPSQFINPDFADTVLGFLDHVGMPAGLIELELTESVAMHDHDNAKKQLTKLKQAGVMIAIDDFGTGYSNLSQLYRLPFDHLKLDRSLISLIGVDPQGQYIVRSLIQMAHSLGHRVVAEGVETAEQLALLRDWGCDMIQGYLCGRPMAPEDFDAWMASRQPEAMALAS